MLARRARRDAIELLALTLPTFAIVGSHWMWWGGPCPPGRFLIPLLPLWAPALVAGFSRHAGAVSRLVAGWSVAATLAISAISLGSVAALTRHKHFLRPLLLGFDAFPPLPKFFYLRSDVVPPAEVALAAFWIVLLAVTLPWRRGRCEPCSVGVFSRSIGAARPRALLIGGVLLLGAPGAAATLGFAVNNAGAVPRTLEQLNYLLEGYAKPFTRAGRAPKVEAARIPERRLRALVPAAVTTAVGPEKFVERQEVQILNGKFTTLYPVAYQVDFTASVATTASGPAGYLAVAPGEGRDMLWRRDLSAADAVAGPAIRAAFRPDGILGNAEFRYVAVAPGTFTVGDISVEIQLP